MKYKDPNFWGAILGAGLLASVVALPQARGELVLDDEQQPVSAETTRKSEERESLRQVISASQKAQAVAQAPAAPAVEPVAAPQVIVQTAAAPVAAPAIAEPAVEHYSKTELMRRSRMREEMKNEDILQERLEELRLRDERRRTDQVLGITGPSGEVAPVANGVSAPLTQEVVVAPITNTPGQPAVAPTGPVAVTLIGSAPASTSFATASVVSEEEDKTELSITPRAGMASMSGDGNFNVQPRFSAGVSLGVTASENIGFEVGYMYNEYGVTMLSTNPFVTQYQLYSGNYNNGSTFETQAMKQNVGEAGLKLHVLSSGAKFRPFVSGGGAYSKSYVNYDQRVIAYFNQSGLQGLSRDYEVSSFLGYLGTGFDVKMSKSVSITAGFKYYKVLSARENTNLPNYGYGSSALAGGYPYYNTPVYGSLDADKQYVGGSLARSSFYTISGGVSFSF